MTTDLPSHIGSYLVTGLLGQGAVSRVYRARLPLLGEQEYAVKLLRAQCKAREISSFECAVCGATIENWNSAWVPRYRFIACPARDAE